MAGDDQPPTDDAQIDSKLLRAWAEGEVRAGDRLTQKYFDSIRSYFVRRVPDEHEDLVQETFKQLARAKGSYRGEASVRVFLYSIARNVLLDFLRKRRRRPDFDPWTTSLHDAWGRRPSSMVAEQQHHNFMLDALQEIPSADQDLLELRYWQGMTGPELAALFDISEGSIRSRLRAAIGRLRKKYEEVSERPVSEEELERWMSVVEAKD